MLKRRIFCQLLFCCILVPYLYPGCTRHKTGYPTETGEPSKVYSKGLWEGKRKVKIHKLLTIGGTDIKHEEYVFGIIRDIEIDHDGNIYVLDLGLHRVQKFSPDGIYLASFGREGKGPGEFTRPVDIAVDDNKNLYVVEDKARRITVFDSLGNVKHTFRTPIIKPMFIEAGMKDTVFVAKSKTFDPKEPQTMVYKYTSAGKLAGSFCEEREDSDIIARAGMGGRIAVDGHGDIYYTFFYPYDVRKFNSQGVLLDRFARKVSFYRPPEPDKEGTYIPYTGVCGMITMPDGKLVIAIYDMDVDVARRRWIKRELYLDFFDQDGNYLITIQGSRFGVKYHGMLKMASDPEGNLYLDIYEPYPHIAKFSLKFVDITEASK